METKPVGQINITKELFIESINQIELQHRHDQKCSEAFKMILPNDYLSCYDNHWLQNQLVSVLQIAMNDNHEHSWIEHYMWELDFGRKNKELQVIINESNFKLETPEHLWNLLNLDIN